MVDDPVLPSISKAAANGVAVARFAGVAVEPKKLFKHRWTHVIVGGGSAGCVMARRLSEHPGCEVLLIEAGQAVDDPAVNAPPAWPSLARGPFDWAYHSTEQAVLAGRSEPQPRGKGLGGSTIINALGYQRGPHGAYDRWAQEVGDRRWSFAAMLPCFRRMETASAGGDQWRGNSGPLHALHLGYVSDQNPLSADLVAAGIETGHPFNPDWNGASAEGAIWSSSRFATAREIRSLAPFSTRSATVTISVCSPAHWRFG
jgi:choline dehydrogenase